MYASGVYEGYAGAARMLTRVSNEYEASPSQDGWMDLMDATHNEANAYQHWLTALAAPPVDVDLPLVLLGRFMSERFLL